MDLITALAVLFLIILVFGRALFVLVRVAFGNAPAPPRPGRRRRPY